MRKHEDEALQILAQNIRRWHEEEFGEAFNQEQANVLLDKMKQERTLAFLRRRITHLSDEDFTKFIELFNYSAKKKEKRT